MTDTLTQPVLKLENIRKAFGGIVAIENFSLDVHPGEIVALVGDNGAGKSTLIKIISGVHAPTSGSMVMDGAPIAMSSATKAREHGIEVVYQDLALADQQSVYMNLFLGREMTKGMFGQLDRKAMIGETQRLVDELDVRIPSPHATIRDLSGGQRQGIAIARATRWAKKLILLDEPTAGLDSDSEVFVLEALHKLAVAGKTLIFSTHHQALLTLANRVLLVSDGEVRDA